MLYNNKPELIKILKQENLYTEKKLGQNFLCNPQVVEKMIMAADLQPTDTVVEVGPGLGILTNELLKKVKRVIAIEKDTKFIPYLEKTFAEYDNLEILHQDVLKSQLPTEPYKVVANIPFYITSPIISHFLQNQQGSRPSLLILLTQLEVAEKICAKDGEQNILSLQTQVFTKPEIISQVSPDNFLPAPKVSSAILKLNPLSEPLIKDTKKFIDLIKRAYLQKRKTLANSLNGLWGISKQDWSDHLEKNGISALVRPQALTFAQWNIILTTLPINQI